MRPDPMRNATLAGAALLMTLAGVVGCGPRVQPAPVVTPPPVDPELERKREGARYQERIVMDEVARTHPALTATLRRDLDKLREELRKAPNRINEVRRDMRLGPPLREACRLRWEAGISDLMSRGAKCLGDSQCESCVRSHVGTTGGSSTGSSSGGGASGAVGGSPARTGDQYPSRTTGGYLGEAPTRSPQPAP